MLRLPKVRSGRLAITLAIALLAAVASWYFSEGRPGFVSDFAQLHAGARALLAGHNPYQVVGPGRVFELSFPLLYPLPAVLVAIPFAPLPLAVAGSGFVGIGAGLLAWALTQERLNAPQLLMFASFGYWTALRAAQWSPVLTAAALLPSWGWILVAKPTIGGALFLAYPARRALVGALALVAASLVIQPSWPADWLAALPMATHVTAPVTRPWGWLLLIAAVRWRHSDGRLLLALACTPQTLVLYEAVPLFLLVRTLEKAAALVCLTLVVLVARTRADRTRSFSSGRPRRVRGWCGFSTCPVCF